jgi:hypothetical protein
MAESVSDVVNDLRSFLNDALATAAYARLGIMRERAFLEQLPVLPENPDPVIHLGMTDPNETFAPYSRWKLSTARLRLGDGGPVERRLGQQWIVYTYAAWEHEFRPRLGTAHGCTPAALKACFSATSGTSGTTSSTTTASPPTRTVANAKSSVTGSPPASPST